MSFSPNELNSAIDTKKGNEIAVWSLLANDKNKHSLYGDMAENAKKADWAFVLKISIRDDHETEDSRADMTVENQVAESAPPDEVIGLALNPQTITIDEAVSNAIKEQGTTYLPGNVTTEGHVILEIEETDDIP